MEKSAFFDQVMLYNNQDIYTVGLLVVNQSTLKDHLSKRGLDPTAGEGQKAALEMIKKELNRFMPGGDLEGMFPPRWLPAAVSIIREPFAESNGLMNSTMKIVRPAIQAHYRSTIDFLYTPEGKNIFHASNMEAIATLLDDRTAK